MLDRARTTALAASLDCLATIRTLFDAPIAKISAVYFAVALLAQSYTVAHIKAQIGIFGPRLDVVRVNVSILITALLTGVIVSLVYRNAPQAQIIGVLGALALKRFTALPSRSERANKRFARARAGAKPLIVVACSKALATVFTVFRLRRVADIPAFLGAVASLRCFAVAALKNYAAHLASELLATAARLGGVRKAARARAEYLPFVSRFKLGVAALAIHRFGLCNRLYLDMYYTTYADVKQAPRYADVILRRAEAEGLTVERVETPMEA